MRPTALLRFAAALLAVFALAPTEPLRGQGIPVRMPGPASSLVGTDFDVPIEVDLSARSEKLGSFALRLSWNPAVLQFVHGVNGGFGDVFANEDSLPLGVARLAGANPQGVGGKFLIGTVRFRPLAAANDTLRLRVDELYAARTFTSLLASAVPSNRAYCPAVGRYGDPDGNGAITAADAQLVLMRSVGLTLPAGTVPAVGDVDGDGVVGTRDALIILSRVVELDVSAFPLMRVVPGDCGDDQFVQLAVEPGNVTALVGQEIYYSAIAIDSTELPAGHAGLEWISSAPAVATVDSSGAAQAVSPGQSVITVREPGGRQASVTLTVVSTRRTHWVDALLFNNSNQLGTPLLPFATINDAMDVAQAGDSVLVRKGRYQEMVTIDRSLTLVGIGDSAPVRPLIAGVGLYPTGVKVTGGQRVEIRGFRFDTLYYGVDIDRADTVHLVDTDFRSRYNSYASVYVDSVGALYVRRSRFDGMGSTGYYNDAIYISRWAGLVSLDSTLITDFGGDALVGFGLDSLVVMNSVVRHNYYGIIVYNGYIADTARTLGAVFRRNLFLQNSYGHVSLTDYASAAFDHNVITGGGYDGIELYGDTVSSRITLRGDSITNRDGYWMYASSFDSMSVDSSVIFADYGYVTGGRVVSVTRSRFLDIGSYALEVEPYPRDSTRLVTRNVELRGHPACDRCADGFYTYYTTVTADSVSGYNLDYGFYQDYGSMTVQRSVFENVDSGLENDCGTMRINRVTFRDAYYAVEAYGCAATDSLVVDSSAFLGGYQAIYAYNVATVLRRDTIVDYEWGVEADYNTLLASFNRFLAIEDGGIEYYGDGLDSAVITNNEFVCAAPPYSWYTAAIEAEQALVRIRNNTISNCPAGIYGGNSNSSSPLNTPFEVRGNTITSQPGGSYEGIEIYGSSRAAVKIAQNTVTGHGFGSISLGGEMAFAEVDSNVISQSPAYGIKASTVRRLFIRGNTITNVDGRGAFRGGAIYLESGGANDSVVRVHGNRITGSKYNGIVLYRTNFYDTVTVRVDSNTVKGADSVGIWIGYYSKADVSWNAIDSTLGDGIRLSELYRTVDTVSVDTNNITRSRRYGINNLAVDSIPATNNFWGAQHGPRGTYGNGPLADTTAADSVSNYVAWNPYAGTARATFTPAPPVLAAAPLGLAPLRGSVAPAAPTVASARTRGVKQPRPPHVRAAPPEPPAPAPRVRPAGPNDETRASVIAEDARRASREAASRPERRAPARTAEGRSR